MSLKTLFSLVSQNTRRPFLQKQWSSALHTTSTLMKAEDRKEMLASMPAKDEGTAGEKSVDIDTLLGK